MFAFVNKTLLGLKKAQPTLMVYGGMAMVACGVVLACKNTLKLSDILEDTKEDIAEVHKNEVTKTEEDYPKKEISKDLAKIYAGAALRVARIYALPAGVILGGMTCTIGGYNVAQKRKMALLGAYNALAASYSEYRSRVVERYGKDLDEQLAYGVDTKIEDEVVVDADGKQKKEKKPVHYANEHAKNTPFVKYYDKKFRAYEGNLDYDYYYLKKTEQIATNMLQSNGVLFMSDLWDLLGYSPKNEEELMIARTFGWVKGLGDGEVDLRIQKVYKRINDTQTIPILMIDPNHDGYILESTWMSGLKNRFAGNAQDEFDYVESIMP